ncbi:hypothetical protein [Candidatus Methanoprimaticola sp. MG2]|uniref:hypothetical protein n=1 Tax=Candidatus Methanoprimaticola sp. MG2 TaxID=3228838 RepID=UPI0039C5F591
MVVGNSPELDKICVEEARRKAKYPRGNGPTVPKKKYSDSSKSQPFRNDQNYYDFRYGIWVADPNSSLGDDEKEAFSITNGRSLSGAGRLRKY